MPRRILLLFAALLLAATATLLTQRWLGARLAGAAAAATPVTVEVMVAARALGMARRWRSRCGSWPASSVRRG